MDCYPLLGPVLIWRRRQNFDVSVNFIDADSANARTHFLPATQHSWEVDSKQRQNKRHVTAPVSHSV